MATSTTKAASNVAIEVSVDVGAKKNKLERQAPPAKLKLEDTTSRVLRHNLISGDYKKIIENFNLEISRFKDQLKEQEEEAVEQEVKFDEKVHGEGINELNQNLLFEKLKRTIKRSTAPEKVISTLEKQKIVLVDDSYYSFKKGEEQEKALMVSSILKEILSIIGSRIKTYSKVEVKEEVVEQEVEAPKDAEEAKNLRTKKKQNLKWKRYFKDIQVDDSIQELHSIVKPKDKKGHKTSKVLSDGEIRRRKVIGEAGKEIDKINELELSIGENEQFNKALINRKSKLIDMRNNLGKINSKDNDSKLLNNDYSFGPNTEFQDLLDDFLNVKDAPSKDEHDKKQKEYEDFFNDPFVIEQLQRQQLEGILYEYNQPEFFEKIRENERKADIELVNKSINEQEEDLKKINQNIIDSRNNVLKEENDIKQQEELMQVSKSQAMDLFLRNIALKAVDEVSDKFKEQLAENLEEEKKIRRGAKAQAIILDFNNRAAMAFDEIINIEKGKIANDDFSEKVKDMAHDEAIAYSIQNLAAEDYEIMVKKLDEEYNNILKEYNQKISIKNEEEKQALKRAGKAQAIILDFNNWTKKALEEIIESEKDKLLKDGISEKLKQMGKEEANAFYFQNLASEAHDQSVEYLKNEYLKEKEFQDSLMRDARMTGEKLFQMNLVADAIEQETNKFKEENIKTIRKNNKATIIKRGEDAVRKQKALIAGNNEARRIIAMKQRKELVEGAKEEANNLFVKDLKYNADVFAKSIVESKDSEEVKKDEKESVESKELDNKPNNIYDLTDVNNRYLRVYDDSKKIKIDSERFGNLEMNSKNKYGISNDDEMVESLMNQLEELGLGESNEEEHFMKVA